jgi:hypothetical protein
MKIVRPVVLFLLVGCGSGSVPVIDDLNMPATAQLGADGYYDLDGTIRFHDDDDVVRVLRIAVPLTHSSFDFTVPQPLERGTVPLQLRFDPRTPKGPIEYDVSLVDGAGRSSAIRTQTVTLQ